MRWSDGAGIVLHKWGTGRVRSKEEGANDHRRKMLWTISLAREQCKSSFAGTSEGLDGDNDQA